MDLDDQFTLEHLLFKQRKCKSCGITKDLLDDFYLTRKDRRTYASAYSYECKDCTIKRIKQTRKRKSMFAEWSYPDW